MPTNGNILSVKNVAMLAVWILIAIVAIGQIYRDCSGTTYETRIIRDTLRIQGTTATVVRENVPAVIVYRDRWHVGAKTTVHDVIHDTTIVHLVAERDSSRRALDSLGVAEMLILDTVVHLPITLNGLQGSIPLRSQTETDCIAARICQQLTVLDTIIVRELHMPAPRMPSYAVGIGFSYGATLDGRLMPSFSLQLSRILLAF